MLVSSVLFKSNTASVFKIPPGSPSLANWTTTDEIWKGSLKVIEQEDTEVDEDERACGLRLKLELYNKVTLNLLLEDFSEVDKETPWAEVWYNPFSGSDFDYAISNDGKDTILSTPESSKYYKIVTQLPGTGYHPFQIPGKGPLLQVALGLKFEDLSDSAAFSESLAIYRRRFLNYHDTALYEKQLHDLQQRVLTDLRLSLDEFREPTPLSDFDDDDFGNYVGAYD